MQPPKMKQHPKIYVNAIIAGLKQAIQDGRLNRTQVDQSVQRILLMKAQYGIIK